MKNFLPNCFALLFFIIVFPPNSIAQTNVSGFISANTTWNLAGSPYIVIGNALVSHGYTLTIEPGVVVKFDTSTALQIDGELIAIGAAQNRITFTSNQAVPSPGDWAKIHFSDTCVDAVFDMAGNYISGSVMKYCDVMYGGAIGFGEIHMESSSPYFNHCNIWNSYSAGIYCNGSTYVLDSSSINNCIGYGLVFSSFDCGIHIQNDTIQNNLDGGIHFTSGNNVGCQTWAKELNNNFFSSNHNHGAIMFSPNDSVVIRENYFVNNTSSSGIISCGNNLSHFNIDCNKFISNQSESGVLSITVAGAGVIRNNLFDSNSSASGTSVANITGGDNFLHFSNNIINNNSSPLGSCCYFKPFTITPPLLQIDHNIFTNNSGSNIVKIDGAGASNQDILNMKFNNFTDVPSQIELYNAISYGSPNIFADSNYWGSISAQHIDSVIYDYFDYANQSVVYYQPILSFPAFVDTTCPPLGIGINEIEKTFYSVVFPNPFSRQATIGLDLEIHNGTLRLFNIFGQIVKLAFHLSGNKIPINRENLDPGIYFYEVSDQQSKICEGKMVIY